MTTKQGVIFSVEDNDTDFMTLEFALRSAGVKHPLERCDDGQKAMRALLKNEPKLPVLKASLVLLDLHVPGVDGLQFLKEFRTRDPARRTPIVILSTSSHPRDMDACYLAGADDYVVKPFELEEWQEKVGGVAERWLSGRTARGGYFGKEQSKNTSEKAPKLSVKPAAAARAQLTRTIEGEIIPRLLLTMGDAAPANGTVKTAGPDEVAALAKLVLEKDVRLATTYVETMRNRDASVENIFHALVAPAARLIGDLWKADRCSFSEFSVALSRLQLVLAELSPEANNGTMH